jgi:hypothetical protein
MKTQKIQIVNNLSFKKSSAKHIHIVRILFHRDYTKIDFSYDSTKIQYIKGNQILINPQLLIKTKLKSYQLISAEIYRKPFFKSNFDLKYFSLLFEAIDEDIESFNIIDTNKNDNLFTFRFNSISLISG